MEPADDVTLRLVPESGPPIELDAPIVRVGRDVGCDLVLKNSSVSRLHAIIERTAAGWIIRDQRSANGVFLDKVHVESAQLLHGQTLRIGVLAFRIEIGDLRETTERGIASPAGLAPSAVWWAVGGVSALILVFFAALAGLLVFRGRLAARNARVRQVAEAPATTAPPSTLTAPQPPAATAPVKEPPATVPPAKTPMTDAPMRATPPTRTTTPPAAAKTPEPRRVEIYATPSPRLLRLRGVGETPQPVPVAREPEPVRTPAVSAPAATLPSVAAPAVSAPAVSALPVTATPVSTLVAPTPESEEVALALRQMDDHAFDAALGHFDAVARRLMPNSNRSAEAAQAKLFAGVALLGMGAPDAARGRFRDALALGGASVRLDAGRFGKASRALAEEAVKLLETVRP